MRQFVSVVGACSSTRKLPEMGTIRRSGRALSIWDRTLCASPRRQRGLETWCGQVVEGKVGTTMVGLVVFLGTTEAVHRRRPRLYALPEAFHNAEITWQRCDGDSKRGSRPLNESYHSVRDILADLEGKLDKCTRTGDTLKARCPAHEDTTPSLSVTIGDSGDRVVMYCHAKCPTEDIVESLGWTMRDLFDTDDTWNSHTTL